MILDEGVYVWNVSFDAFNNATSLSVGFGLVDEGKESKSSIIFFCVGGQNYFPLALTVLGRVWVIVPNGGTSHDSLNPPSPLHLV